MMWRTVLVLSILFLFVAGVPALAVAFPDLGKDMSPAAVEARATATKRYQAFDRGEWVETQSLPTGERCFIKWTSKALNDAVLETQVKCQRGA